MKFSVDQSKLFAELKKVERAAATKSTLPTIQGILFEVKGDKLKLQSTNLTIAETVWLDVTTELEGVTVAPRTIVDLVGNLKGNIVFDYDEKSLKLHIKCGKSKSQLNCYDWNDFPQVASVENGLEIPSKILRDGLAATLFSVNEVQYLVTSGVHLDFTGEEVYFESFDGTAKFSIARFPFHLESPCNLILPPIACQELLKVLEEETASISFGTSNFGVKCGNTEIVSQLLEGNFPDYRSRLPTEFSTSARCWKEEFLAALKRVALFATNYVTLEIVTNSLSLKSTSQETGGAEDEIEIALEGSQTTIHLNHKYLKDFVEAMPTSAFWLRQATNGWIMLMPDGNDNYKFMTAPINIK